MKYLSLFLLFVTLCFYSNAQHKKKGQLQFTKTTHDYGVVENWNNQTAEFRFTNTGNTPLMFLPVRPSKGIHVTLPSYSIPPNGQGVIKISYYTRNVGAFAKKIPINHNASDRPVYLSIRGTITTISPEALTDCPDFNIDNRQDPTYYLQGGKVIDKKTGKPIELSLVIFMKENILTDEIFTNRNGRFEKEIKLGLYSINVSAEGYQPVNEQHYLKKNASALLFKLEPIDTTTDLVTAEIETELIDEEEGLPIIVDEQGGKDTAVVRTDDNKPLEEETIVETSVITEKLIVPIKRDIPKGPLPINEFKPNNVVFLIDVSISMGKQNKLKYLKTSIKRLLVLLRNVDYVSVITYSGLPYLVLPSTRADNKDKITAIIDSLKTIGVTSGVKGLEKAYEIAKANYIEGGNNQIILATDALFYKEEDTDWTLFSLARHHAREGIILSIVGFGNDEDAIELMEKMAFRGQGNYIHIEDAIDARNALIEEIKSNSRREQTPAPSK